MVKRDLHYRYTNICPNGIYSIVIHPCILKVIYTNGACSSNSLVVIYTDNKLV